MRILIVDDHELIRKSVRALLSARADLSVCGEAKDGLEAIEKTKSLRPDIILMDVSMPRMDGLVASEAILREFPECNVIMVSQNDPELVSRQVIEIGARGYVTKSNLARDLLAAIDKVAVQNGTPSERAPETAVQPANVEDSQRSIADDATYLLAAIVDSSDDAIISKNLEGIITSWNKGAEHLFGYTAQEAIGRHITLIIPDDRRDEEVRILSHLKQGLRIDHIETIRRRKDGTLVELSVTISPVKDHSGRIVGASKVARDISNAKRIERALRDSEERLRHLSANLEEVVRSRTLELQNRNQEILQQSAQLRELSNRLLKTQEQERRHIARELHDSAGQLVAALSMNITLIAQNAADNPVLLKIADDADHLIQQLSKEIRTTSYLLHPPLLEETGLSRAIPWYVQGLQERSGLEVQLDISEDFGRLPVDLEMTLFRIVQECLTNILRHSGSKIAAIRLARSGQKVSLEIQDHGKGISPEKLADIRAQRTGVGITGMLERVRNFNGQMNIQSNDSGAIVSVVIPVPAADLPATESLPADL